MTGPDGNTGRPPNRNVPFHFSADRNTRRMSSGENNQIKKIPGFQEYCGYPGLLNDRLHHDPTGDNQGVHLEV